MTFFYQPGDRVMICAMIGGEKISKPAVVTETTALTVRVSAPDQPGITQTLPFDGHRLPGTPDHVWLEAEET